MRLWSSYCYDTSKLEIEIFHQTMSEWDMEKDNSEN
jgi:hypothetical protein